MSETSRRRAGSWVALLGGACIVLGAQGCISTPTKSPLMEQSDNLLDMTSVQLRQQIYTFAARYASVIEESADMIIQASDDPQMRESAILWKIESIREVHYAAFKPDPLAGLIDTAVLCGQMVDFFTDGGGSDMFGEHQDIAIEAVAMLNRDIWQLGESLTLSGDPSFARRKVAEFVAEHPIGDLYFPRDPVQPLLNSVTKGRKGGAGAVIGGINEAIDDLSKRLTIYADFMPKDARWQAELAAMRMMQEPPVEDALAAVGTFAEAHESIAEDISGALDLISAEREAAFVELEALSASRLEDVDRLREDTLAALRLEREVLVQVIEAQTELGLQRIQEERIATMDQLEQMVEATLDSSFDRVDDLAERAFFRGLILIIILALVLLIVAVLIARMFRPRPAL